MPFSPALLLTVSVLLLLVRPSHDSIPSIPDFIIVGAGTAGCALASRLCTALPRAQITLLERAAPRTAAAEFLVRSPRKARPSWGSPLVSEIFPSLPNPGLSGRTTPIVTGDTLGGSSAINGLQFIVPLAGTVEKWRIAGLSTRVARMFYARARRAVGFAVQRRPLKQVYTAEYLAAASDARFTPTRRPFSARSASDQIWESVVAVDRRGRRLDSCTAYVEPVQAGACAKNLRLVQGATVTRLVVKGRKRLSVEGVEYVGTNDRRLRRRRVLRARREVILSAGPFSSPKLLQLSGIGPRSVLEAAGIPVKVELAVGNRTQARPINFFSSLYPGVPIEPSNDAALVESAAAKKQFDDGRGGVLSTAITSTNARVGRDAYSGSVWNQEGPILGVPIVTGLCFGNPDSFGYLRVKDANPFSSPLVQLNLLGEQADVRRMLRCMKRMSEIHAKLPPQFNLSTVTPTGSALNKEFLRSSTDTALHFVGGCAVGKVVNRDLLVRGVRGVRVVDASVFSSIPRSAGPLASTYMLAEYVAERLAQSNRKRFG